MHGTADKLYLEVPQEYVQQRTKLFHGPWVVFSDQWIQTHIVIYGSINTSIQRN